ncbi:MAG TPA: SRPBCC domain-containing protein [Actinospica sp.]|jgi:uncharacterized protein YndB with AHSA1/START domain|nr:SRPBCC domain-containing protein [Actinospica sp.]
MDVVRHGSLAERDGRWTLRFARELGQSPERVWTALTDQRELEHWFPTGVRGEWEPGARLQFPFRDEALPTMPGNVLQVRAPELLEYQWGPDTLRFALSPGGIGTHLEFTVVLEELGTAARDGAGWHEALDLLETCLDGDEPWPLGQRWAELAPMYAAAFGPGAAAIGPPEAWTAPENED